MTTKEKPNYYAILTADVRYSKKINANEKLLFAEITALSSSSGICWASNGYFSELFNCTPQAISKWIKNLENNGFISVKYIYKNGSKEIVKREISCINVHLTGINNGIKGINHDLGGYQRTIKDNNINYNNIIEDKDINKEKENLRQSEFFKKLTDYFSQNTEDLKMKMFSFLVARINNGEFEEFQKQTLAYMEYKSLSKETIHRWLGYSAEWKEENWIDKLSKIKTKPKSTIKKALI